MATRHQIRCVNKSDRYNPHERITHIGGVNPDGSSWRLTQEAAIAGIERGDWTFYVNVRGVESPVVVAVSQYRYKYLKTQPDGDQPNNLLSLMECVG
ncbi:MAG: DUF3892 domain-containing protein [Anaerolineae bacterium]|nr:DUF3892 domain-containing protein [Anaerolineae bacterium]